MGTALQQDGSRLDEEAKLRNSIATLIGGEVVELERQQRWRPAWYATVKKGERTVFLYIRGDRGSDIMPFPELKREADILLVLERAGIPVPHVYGMCADPVAIIMDAVPGTRDVSAASSPAEAKAVARQYIDALAAMHSLPIELFAPCGVELPESVEDIALAGLNAYLPLYRRQKTRPEPLIEFAIRWLRNNVPANRTKPSFIAFDAGQFLFESGSITALYDFEFAMVGDPLADLATMAMRQSVEPMGDSTKALCEYYSEITGQPFQPEVMRYHHALFATVACMQFAGAIANPKSGEPNDVYVEWDLALRRSLLLVLADCMQLDLTQPDQVGPPESKLGALMTMLGDAVELPAAPEAGGPVQMNPAQRLTQYVTVVEAHARELEQLACVEAELLLGYRCATMEELNARLEQHVLQGASGEDSDITQLFYNQIQRLVDVSKNTQIGTAAVHVRLEEIAG